MRTQQVSSPRRRHPVISVVTCSPPDSSTERSAQPRTEWQWVQLGSGTVSYTHLTLPTSDLV